MRLVYKFNVKQHEHLKQLCKISKNLYNQALYVVKHKLNTNNKWLFYNDLNTLLQHTPNLEGEINYRLLKAQVSQQCLKILEKDVKSYIKAIKDYSKNKSKYNGCPRFPKYKKNLNQLIYTTQSCSIKNGYIHLSKTLKVRIPQWEKYKSKLSTFQQVRINPHLNDSFVIEIVYIDNTQLNYDLNMDLYASIDLGVNNMTTLVLPNSNPLLYNGKQIKSKNQYFNKTISRLKSCLGSTKRSSKQIKNLYNKREHQIEDVFHKLSRNIIKQLINNKVGNLVVGYNKGWKDSIHLGKRNNQTFVSIPYERLINYLRYKCEQCGIHFNVIEEGYTSKCDALAFEQICKHDIYLGKRVKRGLYQSSVGKLINADVNGSLNILRKVVGDCEQIVHIINSGWLFQPLMVNIL